MVDKLPSVIYHKIVGGNARNLRTEVLTTNSKKNRLAIFHSAYLNQFYDGSPQRRLTSAFDLVFYQVGTVGSDLKFLGTSPVYCCPNILIPES